MNWYKTAQENDNNWTPEERSEIGDLSSEFNALERNDGNAKVYITQNTIGNNNFILSMASEYAISTQVGTNWDRSSNSLYVEKVAPDLFEVNINETGFKQYDNFETVKDIIRSFSQ